MRKVFSCHRILVSMSWHDYVIKWKHFPRYWPFVWGIHRSPVNSPHKGQWRGALMSKQSWGWWFELPSRQLWRQCNGFDPCFPWRCVVIVTYQILIADDECTFSRRQTLTSTWQILQCKDIKQYPRHRVNGIAFDKPIESMKNTSM